MIESFRILLVFLYLTFIGLISASSPPLNGTGATFPGTIYVNAALSYLFEQPVNNTVSYVQAGATAGKCNIMGYWNTGNAGTGQQTLQQIRDTYICSDTCTGSPAIIKLCGNDSKKFPRFDRLTRRPIVDYGVVTSKLTAADRTAFPDLQAFPAIAGAVVMMYNIPELSNASSNLVLSRATTAAMFRGSIKTWNDYRILNDNTGIVKSILSKMNHSINIVLRADSAGQSQIFTTALSNFDPCCLTSPDYSFATQVGANERPKWCGPLTNEIQVIRITGCSNSILSVASRLVTLYAVGSDFNIRKISFDCNATAAAVQSAFNSVLGASTVITSKSGVMTSQSIPYYEYTIGYWGTAVKTKNWYEPILSASPYFDVTVSTLQEGGFWNSHYNNSAYVVTSEVQSLWISKKFTSSFQLSYANGLWTTPITASGSNNLLATTILKAIKSAYAGLITSVSYVTHSSSVWQEYQITFNTTRRTLLQVKVSNNSESLLARVNTFLEGNNYPMFFDAVRPMGYSGSGKYTCYRHEDMLAPWSYYTGWNAGGVTAQIAFLPYSIGYGLVEDAQSLSLTTASLINRAGQIVRASADSVSVAVMEKGGNLDANLFADLTDGTSQYTWPITGFSYFVIRTKAHLGDCSRRKIAMNYLYNFYYSSTVSTIANQMSMATLPQYVRSKIVTQLINTAKCSNGEYALAQYLLPSSTLLGTTVMSNVIKIYLSVYHAIDASFSWDYESDDNSEVSWTRYIASPDSYVGIFTLFPSLTSKETYYSSIPSGSMTITAFAYVAAVSIFHLNAFTAKTSQPLVLTGEILADIYCGRILYWNDTKIQAANGNNKMYLPNTRILVVGRSSDTDINAMLSIYLSEQSARFKAAYKVPESGLLSIPFLNYLSSKYTQLVSSNAEVDAAVTRFDGALGYYLQVGSPLSLIASLCTDPLCHTVISPTNQSAIQACATDPSTLLRLSDSIISYHLLNSSAKGCYPMVATVDYGTVSTPNAPSCSGGSGGLAYKRGQFSSWLFNGSSIDQSLNTLAVSASSTSVRSIGYENICNIECSDTYLGYSYCNYRTCSWYSGDYLQIVGTCQAASMSRKVSYVLKDSTDCVSSDGSYSSKMIGCDHVDQSSVIGIFCYVLSGIGISVCIVLLSLLWRNRQDKVIRWAQPVFMYISIAGSIALNVTIIVFVGPNVSSYCIARPWMIGLSSTLMFGPLLMKLHRVDKLMNNRKLRKLKITDANVLRNVIGLCLVDVLILSLWTILYRPSSVIQSVTYSEVNATVEDTVCSEGSSNLFSIILVVYKALLIIFGIAKAVSTWKVKSDISDAKHFALAIYNITVVGGIVYAMVVFLSFNASALVILKTIGLFLCSTLSATIVVVPKLLLTFQVKSNFQPVSHQGSSSAVNSGFPSGSGAKMDISDNVNEASRLKSQSVHGPPGGRRSYKGSSSKPGMRIDQLVSVGAVLDPVAIDQIDEILVRSTSQQASPFKNKVAVIGNMPRKEDMVVYSYVEDKVEEKVDGRSSGIIE